MTRSVGEAGGALTSQAAEAKLLLLIRERLHIEVVDPEGELFETGLIDSLGFVDLLLILSSEFGIEVDMADLDTENFRTVRRVASYVVANSTPAIEP